MICKLIPNGLSHQSLEFLKRNFLKHAYNKVQPRCFTKFSPLYTDKKDKTDKDLVIVEQVGHTRVIGINRPEKRNCINNATAKALLQAFKDFDEDDNSRAAVLYGVGGNFCAGYDLEEISVTSDFTSKLDPDMGPMGPTWYETSKPVVAAIDGYAVAGGLELALWCDIRIVEETAVMGVFCRRLGVPLVDGGTVRLPAVVGLGRALDMILTGRPVRAPEALAIGLANEVCACGSAIGRAVFYTQGPLYRPQEALKADRNSARRAFLTSSLQEALKNERQGALKALKEAQMGAQKFMGGMGRHGSFDSGEATPTCWGDLDPKREGQS